MTKNNWTEEILRDLVDIKHGFAFQGEFFTDEETKEILLTPGNFAIGGGFKDDKLKYYFGEVPDEYVLSPQDLIVTMTDLSKNMDTLGYSALVPDKLGKRFLHNQRLGKVLIRDEKQLDKYFLYYLLRTKDYRNEVKASASGSVIKHTSPDRIRNYKFLLPPLLEQHAIARILVSLDDKIELNRSMNVTLKSMAQALFRKMIMGEDENWKQGSILEFTNLLSGGTPSTSEETYWNGNIEWVSAKDVGNVDGIFLLETEKKITQSGIENSSTKLLPAKTTIVTARGTVGAHCMLGKAMTMNQTNYGLKAKEGIGDYFVYFALSEMVEQLKQQSYGTIFDTITTKTFQSAQCIQPPKEIINEFEKQVTPMMDAVLNHQKQSRTLASLRDTLLPKLISGELKVQMKKSD